MGAPSAGRLLVMRHAKSSWKRAESVHDSERRLNKRGRRDAARMGAELRRRALFDEDTRVLVSHAARARETYELLREGAGVGAREAVLPGLYDACHGSARAILELLRDDEDARAALASSSSSRAVLLIGHNPGLEALVRLLAGADGDGAGGEMGLTLTTANVAVMRPRDTGQLAARAYELEALIRPRELGEDGG